MTSQITTFEFDVTSDGFHVTNLKTGQVNVGCTPPSFSLSGGEIDLGSFTMTVSTDGSFGVDYNDNGTITTSGGTTPYTGHTTITGHFSGPTATGTLEVNLTFTYSGVAYACGSGRQTWTAPRVS